MACANVLVDLDTSVMHAKSYKAVYSCRSLPIHLGIVLLYLQATSILNTDAAVFREALSSARLHGVTVHKTKI